MPAAIPIIGAVVGAAGSMAAANKQAKATKQAADNAKAPWSEAQPWIQENMEAGQQLQDHYKQNPWNSLQQTGYQNLYGDIDNFRSSIAPGLMNYANGLMNTNYQRQAAGSELGASNPYSSNIAGRQSQGLLSSQPSNTANMQFSTQPLNMGGQGGQSSQGLLGSSVVGPTTTDSQTGLLADRPTPMPKGGVSGAVAGAQQASGPFTMTPNARSYGTLDFTALNPWTSTLKPEEKPAETEPDKQTVEQMIEEWMKANDPGYIQRREINKWGDGGA